MLAARFSIRLIKSQKPAFQALSFDLFVRGEEAAKKLRDAYGERVNPIQWKGLTDTAFIADTAAKYDIVVNTGSGCIVEGAKAFVEGLARRIKPGVPAPWLLHISGCTNFGDRPLTETSFPNREWDDADGSVLYEYLQGEEARHPYPQRTTEVAVLTTAEETGVQAVSLNAGCIFGVGTGLFHQQGIIVPRLARYVVEHGYGFKLTETANFEWVHVEDLADAYGLLLKTILGRQDRGIGYIPSGRNGILFPSTKRALQTEMMQLCLDAAFDAGILPRDNTPKEKEIRQAQLQEIADEVTDGLIDMAEQGWAGNKAQKGTVLRNLVGWNPTRLEDAWRRDYVDEIRALKDGKRGEITLDLYSGSKA
ncbi:hypothetical protein B0J15DRAFT_470887 [Fusarium solani]|uniref:Uncharacterized protein n=1 Tax=Fusarium solani TaxID=169388 RepID=A0A9P9GG21_FUSSL|nr:uncharacterized protein B0J15DRAFT_470887 [Fusarium solani]KAH7237857.1 hypothetical protein B0J15DRAFT_470887 [Fusarium solani]